jgi:hypothetical protein
MEAFHLYPASPLSISWFCVFAVSSLYTHEQYSVAPQQDIFPKSTAVMASETSFCSYWITIDVALLAQMFIFYKQNCPFYTRDRVALLVNLTVRVCSSRNLTETMRIKLRH